MGTNISIIIKAPPENFNHFSVKYVDRSDDETRDPSSIEFIFAPFEILKSTENILKLLSQIEGTSLKENYYEFKVTMLYQRINYLMCTLIKEYYSLGWHYKVSSKFNYDATIFEKKENINTYVMCVGLGESDRIIVCAPDEIIELIKQTILMAWGRGIQSGEKILNGFAYKLKGNPWKEYVLFHFCILKYS